MQFDNQFDFKVDRILDKKVFNGKTLYLVKWMNFPIEQATWQVNKLLVNVKDKIKQFKYSKRNAEDIPNIKLEQDMPELQVRDTFQRKRGRPPKLSIRNIRITQKDNKKKDADLKPGEKRGRGRPRGSKNKKPRQTRFLDQSFTSEESSLSSRESELQQTLSNPNLDLSQQKERKKCRKLLKRALKSTTIQLKNEHQIETDDNIVESSENQHIQCQSSSLNMNNVNIQTQSQSIVLESANKCLSNLGNEENTCQSLHQFNSQTQSDSKFTESKKLIIPIKEKSSHSKNEKKHDLKEILDGESTKKISSPNISIPSAKNTQEVVTKPKQSSVDIQKQSPNLIRPFNGSFENSDSKNISKETVPENSKKITSIYLLEHLKINLACLNLTVEEYEDSRSPSLLNFEKQKKFASARTAADKIKLEIALYNRNIYSLPSKKLQPQSSQSKSPEEQSLLQCFTNIVKRNDLDQFDNILDRFLCQFEGRLQQAHHQDRSRDQQKQVQEAYYLVEFNGDQISKKMTSSVVLFYLLYDIIKLMNLPYAKMVPLLHNTILTFKFLTDSAQIMSQPRNETSIKTEKSITNSSKIQDQSEINKQAVYEMIKKAFQNVKSTQLKSEQFANQLSNQQIQGLSNVLPLQ